MKLKTLIILNFILLQTQFIQSMEFTNDNIEQLNIDLINCCNSVISDEMTLLNVQKLINKDANINYQSSDGTTALHMITCNKGYKKTAEFLINNGANINCQDNENYTSLHYAAFFKENNEISKLLIKKGANLTLKNNLEQTPYKLAKEHNNNEIMEFITKESSNKLIELISNDEFNSNQNTLDEIKKLLDAGADINRLEEEPENDSFEDLYNSLHYAVENENIDVIKFLLDNGADIKIKTKNGSSLDDLHENEEIKKLLNSYENKLVRTTSTSNNTNQNKNQKEEKKYEEEVIKESNNQNKQESFFSKYTKFYYYPAIGSLAIIFFVLLYKTTKSWR